MPDCSDAYLDAGVKGLRLDRGNCVSGTGFDRLCRKDLKLLLLVEFAYIVKAAKKSRATRLLDAAFQAVDGD